MTTGSPATLKLRMPERLRAAIEDAARDHGTSMNAEIVKRLELSFQQQPNPEELRETLHEASAQVMEALPELIASGIEPDQIGQLAAISRMCHKAATKDRVVAGATFDAVVRRGGQDK